ncbi:MAG: hypothetical protein MUF62_11145 [Chitinophagaceae bacterium]|nr:hypothetical protein [Chitinophagaceae bacterium]
MLHEGFEIGHQLVIFPPEGAQVKQGSTKTAGQVKDKEAPGGPYIFQHAAEQPEAKHVEKQVHEAAVHEHVGEQLPGPEQGAVKLVQGKGVGYGAHAYGQIALGHHTIESELRQKHDGVDDDEILYDNRQYLKPAGAELCHVISTLEKIRPAKYAVLGHWPL